jgi:polyhydroxyalkanoate synthesis regulator phasin
MSFKLRNLVASAMATTALIGLTSTAMADSTKDLVQALVSKGVLTEEEGALLTKGRADEMDVQKKKEKSFWTVKSVVQSIFVAICKLRNTTMLGGDEGINVILGPFCGR